MIGYILASTALVGCEEGREDRNASAGQVEFDEFTVDSSRVAGQPHIVKFWFDENDSHGGGPSVAMCFYGKVTIYESPSSARPFGRFTMSWKQLLTTDDPVTGTPQMTGSLSTVDRTDGKMSAAVLSPGATGLLRRQPVPGEGPPHARLAHAPVDVDVRDFLGRQPGVVQGEALEEAEERPEDDADRTED
jgi:hypothetical protein